MSAFLVGAVGWCTLGAHSHAASPASCAHIGSSRAARRTSQPIASTSGCSTSYSLNSKLRLASERGSRTPSQACASSVHRSPTTCSYSFPARHGTATSYRIAPLQPQSQTGDYLNYVLRSEAEHFEEAVETEVRDCTDKTP